MNSWRIDARVFCALMKREWYTIVDTSKDSLIDGTVHLGVQFILIRFLFPTLGMPNSLIAPLFVGSIITILFIQGFTTTFNQVFDLQGPRVIDYYLTLPLRPAWLMGVYIARTMLSIAVTTLPFFFIGLPLLGSVLNLDLKIVTFSALYLLMLLCFSLWYTAAGFWYNLTWVLNNLWPRRIFFIFLFGCLILPWQAVYDFSPIIAYLFLWNPVTYMAEGLRASLLAVPAPIPIVASFGVTISSIGLGVIALKAGMRKRLDPVM